jgi:hypothetical protein
LAALVAQPGRQRVLHHQLAAGREAADGRQGGGDRLGGEVHAHPEPAHQRRPARVEARAGQALDQRRAVGEGVQAGAEDHVLVHAAAGELTEALLGVVAAHGDLRAVPASRMWSPLLRW